MTQKQKGAFCKFCQKHTLAVGNKPNHILHFLFTLFTCGVWLFIWPFITIGKFGDYRCTQCGNRV